MKTTISSTKAYEIELTQRMIGELYCKLQHEWLHDRDKNNYVKLHSKTHKMMNITQRIYNDLDKILSEIPIAKQNIL